MHLFVALWLVAIAGGAHAQLLQVPVKWCTIGLDANRNGRADDNICLSGADQGQPCTITTADCFCGDEDGAPAFTSPGVVGAATTDDVLWARHERTSEDVYIPQVEVTFRSALRRIVDDPRRNFPIIPDPDIGADDYGDIDLPTEGDPDEFRDAVRDCYLEWGDMYRNYGVMVINTRAINSSSGIINGIAQRFFDLGFGAYVLVEDNAYNLCGSTLYDDRDGTANDNIFSGFPCDPVDKLLGHELGHILPTADTSITFGVDRDGLEHTCSNQNLMRQSRFGSPPDQLSNRTFSSSIPQLLSGGCPLTGSSDTETVDQITLVRDAAKRVAGCTVAETGAPCDPGSTSPLSDVATDPRGDVGPDGTDLAVLHVTETDIDDTTLVGFETYRVIPQGAVGSNQVNAFVAMLDLDGDATTGGTPSNLGLPTGFQGAEIVLRLDLTTVAIPVQPEVESLVVPLFGIFARGWRFEGGSFVELDLDTVEGRRHPIVMRAETIAGDEIREHIGDAIAISVDNLARGPRADSIRVQALSLRQPANSDAEFVDRITESGSTADDVSVDITFERPEYPICQVSPGLAPVGSAATVTSTGLYPSEPVHVVFGSDTIGTGFADANGTAVVTFTIPAGSRPGPHLVTVGSDDSALTADCSVEVPREPRVVFEYAAKLICGVQPSTTSGDFARGFYATTINVRNPSDAPARIYKELALAIPPGAEKPGELFRIADEAIPPRRAIAVDCADIEKRVFDGKLPAKYFDGFVVIRSDRSLDVQSVLSTATLNAEGTGEDHSSIHVEIVPERRFGLSDMQHRADLVIDESHSVDVVCEAGDCRTSLGFTVHNIGAGAAGPFAIAIVRQDSGVQLESVPMPTGLAAGANQANSVTVDYEFVQYDPREICIRADSPANMVPEEEETNNELCIGF